MEPFEGLNFENKKVLLRVDYDVPLKDLKITDDSRIRASFPTIKEIIAKKAKSILILCHIDRPDGKPVAELSVKPLKSYLKTHLVESEKIDIRENLRFNPGEEENNITFAKELSQEGDLFVNDAFAVSHRSHASIVSLPRILPSAIGLHFSKEIKALTRVLESPEAPVVFIIGGAKVETKLPLLKELKKKANSVLIGGKLVQEIKNLSPGMEIAELESSGKDITKRSAEKFADIISHAGTVVWNGPMGVFEKEIHSLGTRIIAEAVDSSPAYSVIGGGDTEAAATKFDAESGIDHISMGGGAMLQYLAEGTLPGLEAIKKGKDA